MQKFSTDARVKVMGSLEGNVNYYSPSSKDYEVYFDYAGYNMGWFKEDVLELVSVPLKEGDPVQVNSPEPPAATVLESVLNSALIAVKGIGGWEVTGSNFTCGWDRFTTAPGAWRVLRLGGVKE